MKTEPTKEHVLSKRMNKILESRIENEQDTIEALRELSTFYTENTLQARRNLRSQIEKRNLDINQDFLASFKEVKDSFDSVYDDIVQMNKSIQDMSLQLQNAKSHTKALLQKTSELQVSFYVCKTTSFQQGFNCRMLKKKLKFKKTLQKRFSSRFTCYQKT